MSMFNVATPEEYIELIEVWESAVRATHHFLEESDILFYKSQLPFYFNQVNLITYKGRSGEIEAFIGINEECIEMLFVKEKHRGRGIGRSLVNYVSETYQTIRVDVNEQNEQAYGFYIRMGFKVVDRSTFDNEGKPYPILHLIRE